ncbi:MAG TPA: triple tyrosine motif-containing protein, partial [Rhodothermales bacterium]|nr:triple tyrosine motif-containing protein [Rhodothermales bacterium]
MRRALWCLVAVLFACDLQGQSLQQGLPFFTCTNARDFDAGNQTWHFMQDARGVIYVGNTLGVFEYDGASWRRIEGSGRNIVRSLDRDEKGRIFVGSSADFGYLRPDSIGVNRYVSLLEFVPEEDRAFNDIWTVHATPEGVYLLARERLFRLNEDGEGWSVRAWTPNVRFLYGFWFNGVYYLHQEGHGLSRLSGDTIEPIPGGEEFAEERAQVMLPIADEPNQFLLGTFNRGLFRFDGVAFRPFPTDADAFFRETTLYKGAVLRDGSYALTTLSGGVVILGPQGNVLQYLHSDIGFPTDNALAIFVDRSGVLWVAPRGAVCQVEVSSPLTRFDATLGLAADITDILRHDGVLYLTTQEGVQYLDETSRRLRPVSGFAGGVPQSWDLFSIHGELLVSHGTGIYRIIGDRAELVIPNVQFALAPTGFHLSALDKDRVFVGTFDGLALLRRDESGAWVVEASGIAGSQVLSLEEPEPGLLWIATGNAGIFRIRYENGPVDDWVVDQFGPESGLVPGPTTVYSAGEKLMFAHREGLLRFEDGRFVPDSTFAPLTTDDRSIPFIDEDYRGNVWVSIGRETAVFRPGPSGELEIDRQAFQRFSGDPVSVIYPEEDGIVWFGTDQALIRYDPGMSTSYESNFSALIRRVSSRTGRTVFGGEGAVNANIPYVENSLRFEYAGPTYENPAANEYQSFLEGFDEAWSDWTDEVRRDYTNLSPGNYTFHVRARNVYDHIGDE